MLTGFQWFSLVAILGVTLAFGAVPLLRPDRARSEFGFSGGRAFSAGVFLALALMMMLPSAMHLLGHFLPNLAAPLAPCLAGCSFLVLLWLERITHPAPGAANAGQEQSFSPLVPLIMIGMIAVPSFFLGAALGVSDTSAAVVIFVAIIIHKGSAAFALTLQLVRSRLTRWQAWGALIAFASATPLGIVTGAEVHQVLGTGPVAVIKGLVLSMAAGVFLFMATSHELAHTPLIRDTRTRRGLLALVAGFGLTVLVRFLIGEAHRL